ncbi:EKC/KEOPS complex subunit GON7 [Opisthocomus hoazin]|uniref:EKC/KEOPS complex subunit GON7 n=1 Tax=Opisthocomus hoazin TaxID=30419 RepID=UPI003F5351C1
MELVAELRGRDGRTRSVRVRCPAEEGGGEAAQLRVLRRAVEELQERVAELLAPLVREERAAAGGGGGGGPRGGAEDGDDDEEEEEDEEDEDEDDNSLDAKAGAGDPPAKRTKVQQP